jgi:hypothetical protein
MALEAKVAAVLLPPTLLWGTTGDGLIPLAASDLVPAVRLLVKSDERGVISVLEDAGKAVTPEDLQSTMGTKPHPEVVVAVDPVSRELSVVNRAAQSVVAFERFADFQTRIPPNSQARFRVSKGLQTARISTGADNTGPLTFRFPDGGQAEVGGPCSSRFELFGDWSYTFCSNGRGKVTNADGMAQAISPLKGVFHGGPLVQVPTGQGPGRFERLTPMVEVTIARQPQRRLQVQSGQRQMLLPPDERAKMALANGSQVDFFAEAAGNSLNWTVRKGEFLFRIDGFPGLEVSGLTDQTASIQWSEKGSALRIQNLSSQDNLVVSLPDHSVVTVAPQEVFGHSVLDHKTLNTSMDKNWQSGSSRLAVFFELPSVANNHSRPTALEGGNSAKLTTGSGAHVGHAGSEDGFANGEPPAKRGALLAPEGRPDVIYAISSYPLRPQSGRLMAPRIFQPPATGF